MDLISDYNQNVLIASLVTGSLGALSYGVYRKSDKEAAVVEKNTETAPAKVDSFLIDWICGEWNHNDSPRSYSRVSAISDLQTNPGEKVATVATIKSTEPPIVTLHTVAKMQHEPMANSILASDASWIAEWILGRSRRKMKRIWNPVETSPAAVA